VDLKSLTYTSLAKLDLSAGELEAIHRTARDLNALEGVTGLLVFNGTRFLQIIEGSEAAIDELLVRLRRDRRHSALEIRDERTIDQRSFPEWSMELVRVSTDQSVAKETITTRIPASVSNDVRDRLLRMTEGISGIVHL
jgi:hypothetical protein